MRAVVGALVALLVALIGLGSVTAAEAIQAPALVPYAYDASRYGAPPMGGITERGPPAAYDHAIYDAVANWSHGAEVRSDGPAPAAATDYEHPGTLAEVVWSTGTTDREAQTNSGSSFAFERNRVAAKSADEASSLVTRTVADAREWLGPGGRAITNDAGDKIFLSQNGLRRIRVDIKRPYPHEFGHAHVEEFIDGKWVRSGPIYPSDVPGR